MLTKAFLIEGAELVIKAGYAQRSLIQRRMRVGFATASQIFFGLADLGVIEQPDGTSRARNILVPAFNSEEIAQAIDKAAAEGRLSLVGDQGSDRTDG